MTFDMPSGDDLESGIAQTIGAFFYDALSEEDKDKPDRDRDLGYAALASAIAAKLRTWNADGEVLTLTTRDPDKWRFFDVSRGTVWQWQDGELEMVGMGDDGPKSTSVTMMIMIVAAGVIINEGRHATALGSDRSL